MLGDSNGNTLTEAHFWSAPVTMAESLAIFTLLTSFILFRIVQSQLGSLMSVLTAQYCFDKLKSIYKEKYLMNSSFLGYRVDSLTIHHWMGCGSHLDWVHTPSNDG